MYTDYMLWRRGGCLISPSFAAEVSKMQQEGIINAHGASALVEYHMRAGRKLLAAVMEYVEKTNG